MLLGCASSALYHHGGNLAHLGLRQGDFEIGQSLIANLRSARGHHPPATTPHGSSNIWFLGWGLHRRHRVGEEDRKGPARGQWCNIAVSAGCRGPGALRQSINESTQARPLRYQRHHQTIQLLGQSCHISLYRFLADIEKFKEHLEWSPGVRLPKTKWLIRAGRKVQWTVAAAEGVSRLKAQIGSQINAINVRLYQAAIP